MLTCDLFVRAGNGEVSLLFPDLEAKIGTERALQQHFIITEFAEDFNKWYTKPSAGQQNNDALFDENKEPLLIDGAFFENSSGERWFIDDLAFFDQNGNLETTPFQYKQSAIENSFSNALEQAKQSTVPLTADQLKLAEMMSTPFSFYLESHKPNLLIDTTDNKKVLSELVAEIFQPNQIKNFMDIMSGKIPDMELDSYNMLHPETKKPITYLQYYHFEFDRLKKEQDFLHETALRMQLSPFLTDVQFVAQQTQLYQEYLKLPYETHVSESEFLDFWFDEIQMDNTKLNKVWMRMSQKTGSNHKILRYNFGALYREVSNESVQRMLERHVNETYGPNAKLQDYLEDQEDIGVFGKYFLSIVDFSEKQMAMQRLGVIISNRGGLAESEKQLLKEKLNRKMVKVAEYYWTHHPKQSKMDWLFKPIDTVKLLFNRVDTHNQPYLWMFERESVLNDPNDVFSGYKDGEYTGKMIERFSSNEEALRAFVYERDSNEEYVRDLQDLFNQALAGDHNRMKRFMTNKEYSQLTEMAEQYENFMEAKRVGFYLNTSERAKLAQVESLLNNGIALNQHQQDFYNSVQDKKSKGVSLSKKQLRYLDVIHVLGRHLVARSMAVQKDSIFFSDLEQKAKNGDLESKAKIDLYDYLYLQNLSLSEENDNLFGQPLDRGFMPQVSMNVYETYKRTKSLMDAYIKFGSSLDNTDLYGGYSVTYKINGVQETKTFDEWMAYYKDPQRSFSEKAKAPFVLQKMKKDLEKQWNNGTSPDPMNRKQIAASFSVSNTIPFRTVAKKHDFSVNAARIFMVHFESLIFRKHHNPILPLLQAAQTHYNQKGKNNGRLEAFKEISTYIDDFSDRYFFGRRRGDFSNSVVGNMIDRMLTATTLAFLSLSPKTSGMNLVVGLSETLKQKFAKHGWSSGFKNFSLGLKRMGQPDIIKGAVQGKGFDVLSRKGKAFIQHFNLETFTNIDIENQQDFMFGIADHMMFMQKKTEVIIRGVSILGELTEAQWNSFDVNDQGFITVKDKNNFPTSSKIKELNYYVSSVQGNYTPEGRRNYHNFVLFKSAMLFKSWIADFMMERIRPVYTDIYGKKRQGYYLTLPQVIWSYKNVISNYRQGAQISQKLEPYQAENLRKIIYDLSLYTLLLVAMGGEDDEDDASISFLKSQLLTFQTQLFFMFSPKEMVGMISRPFPWLSLVESWVNASTALWDGKFAKSAELVGKTLPGARSVDFAFETIDLINEE